MSQPSRSNPPSGSGSTHPPTASHARRTSTHQVPASYAYGAPSLSPPATRKDQTASPRPRASPSVSGSTAGSRSGRAARLSGGGGESITISDDEANQDSEEEQDETRQPTAAELGRAPEAAQVRYARLAERRKSTGQSNSNPNASYSASASTSAADTSISFRSTERSFSTATPRAPASHNGQATTVNIATAFAQATRAPLKPAVGASAPRPSTSGSQQKRQGSPFLTEALKRPSQERTLSSILRDQAEAEAREVEAEAEESEGGSGKETHTAGPAAGEGSTRKRKRPTDPTVKHKQGETETDDLVQSEADARARSKAKRSEEQLEPNQKTKSPDTARKATPARRKSGDETYKPAAVSTASSEEDSDATVHKRRRSKGKGRVSNGSTAGPIPIGVRDSQVWMGKKRKGRKGRRSVDLEGGQDGEEETEMGEQEQDDEDDTPQPDNSEAYDPPSQIVAPEDDEPAASFFLRPKSPPPSVRHHFPGHAFGSSTFGSSPGGHSPFNPRIANFGNRPGADPALAALGDQSFASSFGNSLLDEGVRGNSYTYSEEESIMAQLEKERLLPPPSPSAGKAASGLRRRAGPGLNKAGAGLDEIEEEPRTPREGTGEGTLGERLGKIVQPLWHRLQDPLIDWSKIATALGVTLLAAFILWQLSRASPLTDAVPAEPAFSAPGLPAGSLDELVKRLSALENATGELASASANERARAVEDRKAAAAAYSQVQDLASDVAAARATAAAARDEATAKDEKAAKQLEGALKAVRADIYGLVSRVRDLDVAQADEGKARRKLEGSIDGAAKELKALSEQVAKVAREVEEGRKRDEELKKALDGLEKRLPDRFAVEMDGKGKVKLDPAFWRALKEAFPQRSELDKAVSQKIDSELARRPQAVVGKGKAGDAVVQAPAPVTTVYSQPKWDEFIETNDAALRSWLKGDLEAQSKSGAVISRRAVLDIVRKETNNLKDTFGVKLNENMEAVGQEILRKVGQQEEMRRKEADEASAKAAAAEPTKESLVDKLNPFHRHTHADHPANGTVESLIHAVVDAKLNEWSKDVLARPDYAAYPGGAKVIPALTSPTYEAAPLTAGRKALGWLTGKDQAGAHGRPPHMALHPDLTVGACWPFAGQQGSLGVALSRRVVPTDVTIEHAALDVALDGTAEAAPREFEVWAAVEEVADQRRLGEYRLAKAKARLEAKARGDELEADEPTSVPESPNHLLLARGVYDPAKGRHVQTFAVTSEARKLSVPVRVVVLKVLSNHGMREYTCLYRFRVGGRTVGMVQAEPAE